MKKASVTRSAHSTHSLRRPTAVSVVCCRSFGKRKKEQGGRDEASKGGVSLLSLLLYSTEIVIRRLSFFGNVYVVYCISMHNLPSTLASTQKSGTDGGTDLKSPWQLQQHMDVLKCIMSMIMNWFAFLCRSFTKQRSCRLLRAVWSGLSGRSVGSSLFPSSTL